MQRPGQRGPKCRVPASPEGLQPSSRVRDARPEHSSSATLPSPYPAPTSTTCGWFPGTATLLCRTLPAGGPCDMPRACHTGRPERGAPLPALCPHPRTCRAAPPRRFPLSRLLRTRLPTARVRSGPVPAPCSHPAPASSSPRPHATPRGPGSHPGRCFPLRAWLFIESRGSPETHPREETPGGWGPGASAKSSLRVLR